MKQTQHTNILANKSYTNNRIMKVNSFFQESMRVETKMLFAHNPPHIFSVVKDKILFCYRWSQYN